jgi:hypothetical protein
VNLNHILISRKTGEEKFYSSSGDSNVRLLDFWQWVASDLLSNATRGKLAEFLVATDLGIADHVRSEWDPYDLTAPDGTRLEIKTSAYLQSWHQDKYSTISFDIKPSIKWNPMTNKFEGEPARQSDFYIFCLLHHKDKQTVNPLDLDQWTFYILPTETLNQTLPEQKRITMNKLLSLNPAQCKFGEIAKTLGQKRAITNVQIKAGENSGH